MADTTDIDMAAAIREKYGAIAKSIGSPRQASRGSSGQADCGCGPCCGGDADPISSHLYSESQTEDLPFEAVAVSLGCGNPTALLRLQPRPTVPGPRSRRGLDAPPSGQPIGPI